MGKPVGDGKAMDEWRRAKKESERRRAGFAIMVHCDSCGTSSTQTDRCPNCGAPR